MYAVVEIAGKQFKVQEEDRIRVPRLSAEVGEKVTFDKILMVSTDEEVVFGKPVVEGASVEATILAHGKDKKIIVFKKKPKKGYKVKRGHRQPYTDLKIEKIVA